MKTSIPSKLHDKVLELKEEGKTLSQISIYLKDNKVNVSNNTISKLIKEVRKQRQELAKEVYSREVEKNAIVDLNIMNVAVTSLFKEFEKSIKENNQLLMLKISPELRAWTRDMRELSGLIEDDKAEAVSDMVRDEWINKLKS